ncbi:MAG TPA: rubrerythrin family protein [Firmicutes bacterium]|nr:rubrerythrin family protein [Bacillota bacterium]
MPALQKELLAKLIVFQKNELTEYHIYKRLAKLVANPHNQQILSEIAAEELCHYNIYRKYTQREVQPNRWQIFLFTSLARIFGLTFGLKLMEKGEAQAKKTYEEYVRDIPELAQIIADEDQHEHELLNLLEEDTLNYVSSIVLGLNDALVELTGTLAGLTFALQNTRLTALSGLITGIAASFSMGASEYLSTKAGGEEPALAFKSALYTWVAYVFTVIALILPYLLTANYFLSLVLTLTIGVIIILAFNFYLAVAKEWPFWSRFLEMTVLSVAVAGLSFIIGYFLRLFLQVEV